MTPEQMQAILDDAQLKVLRAEIRARQYERTLKRITAIYQPGNPAYDLAVIALDAPEVMD